MIPTRTFNLFKFGAFAVLLAVHVGAQPVIYSYDSSGNVTAAATGSAGTPTIVAQPSSQLLSSNGLVTFSVVARGAGLTYQWLSNGVPIAGATSDSLVLAGLTGTNFANYSVIISNGAGLFITSSAATVWLDVNGNGLPDWWEMQYFGNLNQSATADFDGDGVSNYDEYREGTNPADPTSFNPRLHIQSVHGTVSSAPLQPYYTQGQFVYLTAAPDAGHVFQSWGGSISGTKPEVSVLMDTNKTVVANFGLTLSAALNNATLPWTTGGDALWFGEAEVSHDGQGAAQSGPIVSTWNGSTFVGEQTWLQTATNFNQTMQLSFWWNVSSRPPAALAFSLDGTNYASLSGEVVGWQFFQTNLLAGNHVLTWTYSKGPVDIPTGVPFTDAGWVDQVTLAPTNSAPASPVLTIALSSTNTVLVSWPAPSTGFVLQQSLNLAPTNWIGVTNPVNLVGSRNQVIISPSTNGTFYRLKY